MSELIEITEDLFNAGISKKGSWSIAQLACLGVPLPLVRGWRQNLMGTFVPLSSYKKFLLLKNLHLKRKDRQTKPKGLFDK